MVYLMPEIDDSVIDGYAEIWLCTSNPVAYSLMGSEPYTRIYDWVNLPEFNNADLVLRMNSDTLDLMREIIGGSFGFVKIPVSSS